MELLPPNILLSKISINELPEPSVDDLLRLQVNKFGFSELKLAIVSAINS